MEEWPTVAIVVVGSDREAIWHFSGGSFGGMLEQKPDWSEWVEELQEVRIWGY